MLGDSIRRWYIFLFAIAGMCFQSCMPDLPEDVAIAYENLPEELDYNLHVKPVLSVKCFACHGPDEGKRKAELRLDVPEVRIRKPAGNSG